MTMRLKQRREGRVLVLTMATPEARNAVSPALSAEIVEALQIAGVDDAVGAVLLTGEGTAFSAGGDIHGLLASLHSPLSAPQERALFDTSTEAAFALAECRKPTIALINGSCAGGGLGLAAACDIRIASDRAKLAYAYPHIGLAGDFAINWSLHRILGAAQARYFCLLAKALSATEALAIGLVHEVHPNDQALPTAMAMADRIACLPPLAMAQIKANLDAAATGSRSHAAQVEAENFVAARRHPSHRDAVEAFIHKKGATKP